MSRVLRRAAMVAAYLLPCVLLAACSLFNLGSSSKTTKYLIVDHKTGEILTAIEVAAGSTRPERIISYGPNHQITRQQQLEYDSKGRLISRSVVVNLPAGGTTTDVTTYTYQEVRDSSGRLIKTEQFSSKGNVVVTNYGYDANGQPRGVVVQNGKELLMKDYPQ